MPVERRLGICHVLVTVQYLISAGMVILWVLLQTGLHWYVVFPLSVQTFALVVLGAMIYGFATFRGAVGDRLAAEHPFTSSTPYRFLYLLLPVFGGALGAVFWVGVGPLHSPLGLSLGTVVTASAMWLLTDPVVGLVESALPQSRRLRNARLAREHERRERRKREKRELLEKLLAERRARLEQLRPYLEQHGRRLQELLLTSVDDPWRGCEEGAAIGLATWQLGGEPVMRQLYATTAGLCSEPAQSDLLFYLDHWWNGVGEWRLGHGREALAAHQAL
jgi:hypothetical protein